MKRILENGKDFGRCGIGAKIIGFYDVEEKTTVMDMLKIDIFKMPDEYLLK